MTRLERRAGLLLRAYPAGYRRDHGEEIAGTLVEATPAGRDWPLPRESRALILAGLRARAAANGRLGTLAGLRLAALLGVAIYLATCVAFSSVGGWQEALVGLLIAAAVAAGWLAGRTAVKAAITAAAAAAWVIYVLASGGRLTVDLVLVPACLALFAALAAGPRPPRAWLWMPGAVAATGPALAGLTLALGLGTGRSYPAQPGGHYMVLLSDGWGLALLAVLAAAVLWVAVDARPVIGLLVAIGLHGLGMLGILLAFGPASVRYLLTMLAFWLLAPAVLAAPALWRLRRQAARPGRTAA